MAFAKASTNKEVLAQGGNGKHINKSGMFPVTILAAVVSRSSDPKKKQEVVDLYIDHEGQKQVIYGNLRVTNNDGKPNEIGCKIFNQLLIISDNEEVADPVEADLPIGKKESIKTVEILEDLCDVPVVLRVQMEYSVWNGSIKENKVIKGFYRQDDFASAEEIVNEAEFGNQYNKDLEYAEKTVYKDDLTEEQVQEWVKAGRPKSTASNAPTAEKAPAFGKKRTFGK